MSGSLSGPPLGLEMAILCYNLFMEVLLEPFLGVPPTRPKLQTSNSKLGHWNLKFGVWNLKFDFGQVSGFLSGPPLGLEIAILCYNLFMEVILEPFLGVPPTMPKLQI